MRHVVVIGAGIAGLGAAWTLQQASGGQFRVSLLESQSHFGGHANTVDVSLPDAQGRVVSAGVDTGFLVFNQRTYPELLRLFAQLQVEVANSDMSFSVQMPAAAAGMGQSGQLEWCGSDLNSVFAQRRNLTRPAFWHMLADLVRFNRLCTALAVSQQEQGLRESVGDFLERERFGQSFRQAYLLPMLACIWSCPQDQMLHFPMATLIRFCHNHGLLQIANRPQWMTVRGGSREYVRRIIAALPDARLNTPVRSVLPVGPDAAGGHLVVTDSGTSHADAVIFACHPDQSLRILGEQAPAPVRQLLGAIRYQANRAVLHTDARLMPSRRRAWAAWNFERGVPADQREQEQQVCLHYWLNRLQPLPWQQPVMVSLNPLREPHPSEVLATFDYDHPIFDQPAIDAQKRLHLAQGHRQLWFAGAWCGYGFHEDGLRAGIGAASGLMRQLGLAEPARVELEQVA